MTLDIKGHLVNKFQQNTMYNKIKSRDNHKLKYVRKVREGKISDVVFIEGLRLAEEAVRSELEITDCLISEIFIDSEREQSLIASIEKRGKLISELEDKLFQTITDTKNSQGIILICKKPAKTFSENPVEKKHFLFLYEINNPSNLGAILRTAEAAGVGGVIISKRSADPFSPKALRSSMGAGFRLPIWTEADFDEVLEWAKKQNLTTTAADINAQKEYTEIAWEQKRLIVFGSEAEGLSEELRSRISELIIIPMENSVESLNLAVSCGIILFESKRKKGEFT